MRKVENAKKSFMFLIITMFFLFVVQCSSAFEFILNFSTKNSNLPNDIIGDIKIDKNGIPWIGTDNGLAIFNGENFVVFNKNNTDMKNPGISALSFDSSNVCYFGSDVDPGGLSVFNGVGFKWYDEKDFQTVNNFVKAIATDQYGFSWIGTYGETTRFDGIGFKAFTSENSGIVGWEVNSITVDKYNNVWFGCFMEGLSKLDRSHGELWKNYNAINSGLADNTISVTYADRAGNIWIGYGLDNGLSKFDGVNTWTKFTHNNCEICSDSILAICEDNDGNIWVGGAYSKLICKYDGIAWKTYSIESPWYDECITSLAVDRNNNIWIGTSWSGVFILNEKGVKLSVLENLTKDEKIKISPNPSREFVKISIPSVSFISKLDIYNSLGLRMESIKLNGQNETEIALEGFSPGIYFVTVSSGTKAFSGSFIVQGE